MDHHLEGSEGTESAETPEAPQTFANQDAEAQIENELAGTDGESPVQGTAAEEDAVEAESAGGEA